MSRITNFTLEKWLIVETSNDQYICI